MIALGGIIGAGLFVGSSAAIVAAGPAIVVSYIIAGLLVVVVLAYGVVRRPGAADSGRPM